MLWAWLTLFVMAPFAIGFINRVGIDKPQLL